MTKTISELQHDAVFLEGLIGGAEVLANTAICPDSSSLEVELASNALLPIFRDLRRRSAALADELDLIDGKVKKLKVPDTGARTAAG